MLQGSARTRTAQQSGEDSGYQQEPVRVQSSPHRPLRQKASSSSGAGSNPGIALTGDSSPAFIHCNCQMSLECQICWSTSEMLLHMFEFCKLKQVSFCTEACQAHSHTVLTKLV